MRFGVTIPVSRALIPVAQSWQYQIYHCNSRLDFATARALGDPAGQDPASRYLGTRGFRQFGPAAAVPLLPPIPSRVALQKVMLQRRSNRSFGGRVTLEELSTVLEQALGCTSVIEDEGAGLAHALRAWPSAGGLYPIDCYVLAARVDGLAADVYHYNPILQQLEPLGEPTVETVVETAFFGQDITAAAAAALIFVANFDRTTSKYGERGYRLVLLDSGHAAQNVLLVTEQLGLSATAIGGFNDEALSESLQIDGVDEAPVHAVIIGRPA